jgi:MFS family permease
MGGGGGRGLNDPGAIRPSTYAIFIWHGFFLALTRASLDLNTVFPALIGTLVDSKTVFGLLYSIMLGVPFVFNIAFGHFLQDKPRKKPYLLLAIYLRALAFLGMAAFTLRFGATAPLVVLLSLFGWIFLFSFSGGFAGLAYADIVARLAPKGARGRLYASKQFASSAAMLLGSILVAGLLGLEALSYPANYALILGLGGAGLFVAALAFWFIREEAREVPLESKPSFGSFLKEVPRIVKGDRDFLRFILAANLSSFSLMILPFYMLFAVDSFGIGQEWVGRFLLFQTGGAILSNLLWGYLSHRRGSRQVVRTCLLVGGVIPVVALLVGPQGPGAFLLVFVLVGFVMSGRSVGFEPYLLDLAPEDRRTVYVGINGTLNLSQVVLPALGGIFIDALGFRATFLMVAASMVVAFALLGGPARPLPASSE